MLYKIRENSKFETLFLIGNGAIESGNYPLELAIKKALEKGYFSHTTFLLDTISTLTMLVAIQKSMFDGLILYLKDANNPSLDDTFSRYVNNIYAFITLRKELALEYRESNVLKIRESVFSLLKDYKLWDTSAIYVTTNWDQTLIKVREVENIIQLHGLCSIPSTLILPTETINERALQGFLLQEVQNKLKDQALHYGIPLNYIDAIYDYYDIEKQQKLFIAENMFIESLRISKKIVIVGIEFNSYDHELMVAISNAKFEALKEIVIINLNENKEKRINKIAALFNFDPRQIQYIPTDDLSSHDALSNIVHN